MSENFFTDITPQEAVKDLGLSVLESIFEGMESNYEEYADKPVEFGEEVFGDTYTDQVKVLMRSVQKYPITVAISCNASGKTHCAGRVAAWWYCAHGDAQVYTAAAPPEDNLKRLLWGEIGGLVESYPDVFKGSTHNVLNIQRGAKIFLTGVTIPTSGSEAVREAKFSGKHAPFLLFILDEADAIPDEVYRGIESCMSGGRARLLCMFNPRHESGPVYRMIRDGRANVVHLDAFSHPNVITGEEVIPGAVTREKTVNRINNWCRPLADLEEPDTECFELPDFLERAIATNDAGIKTEPLKPGWYKIVEPAFSYMVLGQYPAQATNQLISKDWVGAARRRWDAWVSEKGENPPQYVPAILGLDVGELGTDANVLCIRWGGFVEKLIPWNGVDPVVTARRTIEKYKEKNPLRACVDATGVGSGVAPLMQEEGCAAFSVKVGEKSTKENELGTFFGLRDELWWAAREWLRIDPSAMLPPDEYLVEELLTASYEVKNGKIKVMAQDVFRELIKRSPDRADSLRMTFYDPEALFDDI